MTEAEREFLRIFGRPLNKNRAIQLGELIPDQPEVRRIKLLNDIAQVTEDKQSVEDEYAAWLAQKDAEQKEDEEEAMLAEDEDEARVAAFVADFMRRTDS